MLRLFFWPIRVAIKLLTLLVLVTGAYFAWTGLSVWQIAQRNQDHPAGAILIMGAAQYNGVPSADLASRCSQALSLWQRHLAPRFILTGGKQPGDTYSEAQAEGRWLVANGVPSSAILAVVGGNNTYESMVEAAAVLRGAGIKDVLAVSDPFHEARVLGIASELHLTAYPSPTRTSPIQGSATVPYFAKETLGVGAGRLVGYGNLELLQFLVLGHNS